MVSNMGKKFKVICSLVMLAAIALTPLAGMSNLQAQEDDTFHLSPLNPALIEFFEEPPEPFYGYIPPPMDLSHLNEIPVERPKKATSLPDSFDWRDQDKVTSIKDQNPCGTCWAHGTLAAVESRVLITEGVTYTPSDSTYNYSEQNLICCTDPAWEYLIGNRCMGGGWSWLAADTLTKKGSRLEACQPYDTDTIDDEACDDSCQSIKMVTDYRMIANEATSTDVIVPIKNAIYSHGPLAMSYAADDGTHMHEGSIYYWPDCPAEEVNHLVCIVGWDDTIAHPEGGGSGAWIVKNSWGTGWEEGDNGYFYLCYGSAGMCEVASLDYKDYDPNEQLYYWDEAGQVDAVGCPSPSAWLANIFTSTQDGELTHVDFWTTSNNAEYEIYVYLDGDISDGLDDRATSQSGTCQEFGYYSIPLDSPVSLTNGQPFTIAVNMTTPGFDFPIPIETLWEQGETTLADPPIQSGVSYARCGDTGAWDDLAGYGCNACLRGRVTSEAAGQPDITVDPTSFDETLPPDTTQDYTLTISNDGDANLNYDITDTETTGDGDGSATPAGLAPSSISPDTANADEIPLFEGLSPPSIPAQEYVPNQLIVKFKDKVTSAAAEQLNQSLGTEVIYTSSYAGFEVLQVPEGKTVPDTVEAYSGQPIVEYAEPNYIYHAMWSPDDTYYSYQWHFDQINMEAAWDLDTTPPNYGGDPSIVVAVIDSGVAYETYDSYVQAPDLADTTFVAGYDFVNDDAHPNDDNRHGTHVCGTVAQSTNNGLGVAGIAFNTTVMPIKVLDSESSGTTAQIADGVYYAVDNGAHIINMSLGGESPSTTIENAVAYAYNNGVTVVAAAGNDYEEGNDTNYPAAHDDYCIAVGATRYDQTRAPYSNTGSYLDIVAPGGDVTVDQNDDGYDDGVLQQTFAVGDPTDFACYFLDGTSMACPHVAGVAALILAKNPSFTPDQVREALESTATDLGAPGRDDEYGWGLLNAPAAAAAAEDCPWLSETPSSGSVAPGDSHNITITINTTGLAEGDYSAEIVISSNDPDEDPKIVPVTLHVVLGPTLELVEGVNIISYTGATTSLPEALTNIADLVEIIWARGAWTGGEWHRFFFYSGYPTGELEELENGRAYIIVVSEHCIWELPQ